MTPAEVAAHVTMLRREAHVIRSRWAEGEERDVALYDAAACDAGADALEALAGERAARVAAETEREELRRTVAAMVRERDAECETRKAAEAANERDRTTIARVRVDVDRAISARSWLLEGRGPYEWNDDRYRDEFSAAGKDFYAALEPLRAIASDMAHCPKTQAEVQAARAPLAADLGAPYVLADGRTGTVAEVRADGSRLVRVDVPAVLVRAEIHTAHAGATESK